MSTTIFYGAGEWVTLNFTPIRKLGFEPVCFIDDDPNKHNTKISFGKRKIETYEILSPGEAFARYPESNVLFTTHPGSWEKLENNLVRSGFAGKEQILSYPEHLKITRGCYDMQKRMEVRPTLAYCCTAMVNGEDTTPLDLNNYEKSIEGFYATRNRDIADMKAGKIPERCVGCPNNIEDLWFDRPAVESVAFSLAGRCQFDCLYCKGSDRVEWATNELSKKFEPGKFLSVLKAKNLIEDDADICIASGEPALHPRLEEWLAGTEPYYCEVLTNAAKFSEPIMNLLKRGHSDIFVSLDAGTRETYKKVRGRDMWDRVRENLEKYTDGGGKVLLKYILIPGVNDSIEDADGFLEFAERIQTPFIAISADIFEVSESALLPEQTIAAATHLLRSAKRMGLNAHLLKIFFNSHDCELIMSGVEETTIRS